MTDGFEDIKVRFGLIFSAESDSVLRPETERATLDPGGR